MAAEIIVAVDDQPEVRRLLADIFRARGRELVGFSNGDEALAYLRRPEAELALIVLDLDLGSNARGGLALLPDIRGAQPDVPVIILTGNANIDAAVQAVKLGAADFLLKDMYLEDKLDLSVEKIERMLAHLRERRRLEGENRELRAANRRLREAEERRLKLVGESPAWLEGLAKVERVPPPPPPPLLPPPPHTGHA